MKNKITILYDNTDNYMGFDETRKFLFDTFAYEHDWKTEDDVPEQMVYNEMDDQDNLAWQDFYDKMYRLLSGDIYLLKGTNGRWYGPAECGQFIHNPQELLHRISHLDRVRFYDEDGHLKIWGYHHDGEDNYELKRLTRKGVDFAMRNCFAHDRKLHEIIMKNRVYSALPRLAQKMKVICI